MRRPWIAPVFSYNAFLTHAIMSWMLQPEGKNMAQPQVLEGTREEILTHNAAHLAGRKVKVYIEAEEDIDTPASPPNELQYHTEIFLRTLVGLSRHRRFL